MATASVFLIVFVVAVWGLLAATAMDDFALARDGGSTEGAFRSGKWAKIGSGSIEFVAFIIVVSTVTTGEANPLIFELFLLQAIVALVAHDARARGEWKWSGRIHGSFALLAVILMLSGRYAVVVPSMSIGDGAGAWSWIVVIATLVLGLAPVAAYFKARGARLDGRTPTVTFVKGVMGASSDTMWMALPRYIIAFIILAGIAINGGNVIGRYVYLAPIIWAEEIMIYGMVWTVFIGAVLVTWDGRHLRMDLLTTSLPSPWKEILNGIGVFAFILICIFVIPQNWIVFSLMERNDQRSIVAEIPMAIPHFALLLGFVLMLMAIVGRLRRQITGDMESSEIDDLVADDSAGSSKPASVE